MAEQREQKEININQVTRYLNHAFVEATKGMGKAARVLPRKSNGWENTKLYDLQVEFMHLLHDIKFGPMYLIPKVISDTNKFIDGIKDSR